MCFQVLCTYYIKVNAQNIMYFDLRKSEVQEHRYNYISYLNMVANCSSATLESPKLDGSTSQETVFLIFAALGMSHRIQFHDEFHTSIILHSILLTNSMELSPWEAASLSASQQFSNNL
jgi:hypothetical protein